MSKPWIEIVPKSRKSRFRWLIYATLAAVYIWAFSGIPFGGIKETEGVITKAIFSGIFSPDWGFVYLPDGEDLLHGLLDASHFRARHIYFGISLYSVRFLGSGKYEQRQGHFRRGQADAELRADLSRDCNGAVVHQGGWSGFLCRCARAGSAFRGDAGQAVRR